jgi:hypothetical protein
MAKKKHPGVWGWVQDHATTIEAGLAVGATILAPELAIPIIALTGVAVATQNVYNSVHNSSKPTTKKPTTKKPTNTDTGSAPVVPWKKVAPYTGTYQYNAPMVRDSEFNFPSLDDTSVFGHVDLQAYENVKNAWVSSYGNQKAAKGAFQMDRYLWKSSEAMKSVKSYLATQKQVVPTNMYGFRFLYNPQTIEMTWGQSSFTNNQALLQGLDTIHPIAPGSMASGITFTIPLNRIQDANYLNPDGSYAVPITSAQAQVIPTSVPIEVRPVNLPYFYDVPISERKLIYERGTMYDIEWLMKAINGWAFLDHTSDVSGLKTNDMGFILQFPVELHLGNAMRYRVQVTDIRITHIIFNPRMIPIFSQVTFTCRRFPEQSFSEISKYADPATK